MDNEKMYTKDEVQQALTLVLMLLDNGIFETDQGENDNMANRLKQCVEINGEKHWVTGQNVADLLENYRKLLGKDSLENQNGSKKLVKFGDYIVNYFNTYKTEQATNTIINRERMLRNHILPQFGDVPIDEITTDDIQKWFNGMSDKYSKETLLKIKNIMSPALDSAVEDGLIKRNPIRSVKLTIGGRETVHHKALEPETIETVRNQISTMDIRERRMAALLCSTGMRIEEILGLRWEDIDEANNCIHVQRAVVHPTRNQPEIKKAKSKKSMRVIPLPKHLLQELTPRERTGFILYSYNDLTRETPLSYTGFRKIFNRIRKKCGIENYSTHDFRDTCATEWRESGVSIDIIARLLGHQKTEVTEQRYVKYRPELFNEIKEKMDVYGIKNGTNSKAPQEEIIKQ